MTTVNVLYAAHNVSKFSYSIQNQFTAIWQGKKNNVQIYYR